MSNPINAETDAVTGNRWYIHPKTGERFISVTTALQTLSRPGLIKWAADKAAEAALDHLEWLNIAAKKDTCGRKGADQGACGCCRTCAQWWLASASERVRDDAAELGTKLHDAAEQDTLFGEGYTVDEDVEPFLDGYLRWRNAWKPEFLLSEATVISRKWGYAGTLDFGATFTEANLPAKFKHFADMPVLGDTKTGKHMDIPKGWQVVAYSEADAILLRDGTEIELPKFERGMILHIRPGKVQVREVFMTKHNHNMFIHVLRATEGLAAGLGSSLSRPYTLKEN